MHAVLLRETMSVILCTLIEIHSNVANFAGLLDVICTNFYSDTQFASKVIEQKIFINLLLQ